MVLITGGLGYLGVRISEYLLSLGYVVRLGSSRENPSVPNSLSGCQCVHIDLSDTESLGKACEGVSVIIHLAALNASSSARFPESALLTNGLGTLKLLTVAEALGIPKFIYMSTVHVYGSPLEGLIEENLLPRPSHHYSISHRLAEDYVLESGRRGALRGIVFRLSNAVGSPLTPAGPSWDLVTNDLCKQVVTAGYMNLTSAEGVLRDYLPISSVVSILAEFVKPSMLEAGIFNLSSGISLTLRELTDLISERCTESLGFTPDVNFPTYKTNDSKSTNLKISNAKIKSLGLEVESDLSHEIDKTLINSRSWF